MKTFTIEWRVTDLAQHFDNLDYEQCTLLLAECKKYYTKEVGLNWGVIEYHAAMLFGSTATRVEERVL